MASMNITTGGPTLGTRLSDLLGTLRRDQARRRTYNAVYSDLAKLSDRDLADIGVSRLQIGDIARDAAYGRQTR